MTTSTAVAAEFVGAAVLLSIAVGPGIQSTELSRDVGAQPFADSLEAVLGRAVFIALLGAVSGARFNPVVTLSAWRTARLTYDGPTPREVAAYLPAQIAGAIGGALRGSSQNGQ
ncbi:aquaporin [Streptomyces sp. NBC_01799]|nr:aquaporin [Streptomyces sp. NBC_01800]WSA82596.1 aquaporin [Streptomyces sp. NBC_01799]